MSEILTISVLTGILNTMLTLATPLLFAALGETFSQNSGVLNLGVDGIMLLGAFGAFYAVLTTGSLWLGLLVAMLIGLFMGLIMSFVSVTLKAEQGVSGIGLQMFGLGMSSLLFKVMVGTVRTVKGFPRLQIPILSDIPIIGPILFNNTILVYIAFALVPISWWILERTTIGLTIKSVGQNPAAADSRGINVNLVRYMSVCFGAVGVFLPLLPTVPFMLLAAFCFARSSPQLHDWLLRHPVFGPPILDWQERGAISRRGKIAASVSIAAVFGLSLLLGLALELLVVQAVVLGAVMTFIWSRPEV